MAGAPKEKIQTAYSSAALKELGLSLVQDFRQVVSKPNSFFDSELDYDGSLKQPLLFHLSVSIINAIGSFLVESIRLQSLHPEQLLIGFAFVFVGGLFAAGFFYMAGKLFGGEGEFRQMYAGVAFAMAPFVLAWIVLFMPFSFLYTLFLFRKVVINVHELDDSEANKLLGAFVVLVCVLAVGYGLMAFGTLFKPRTGTGVE